MRVALAVMVADHLIMAPAQPIWPLMIGCMIVLAVPSVGPEAAGAPAGEGER